MRLISCEPMDPIHHAFTHFDLVMKPAGLRVATTNAEIADGKQRFWYRLDDKGQQPLGLPAPVRGVLDQLEKNG